jgi:uncharacterized membrane protein
MGSGDLSPAGSRGRAPGLLLPTQRPTPLATLPQRIILGHLRMFIATAVGAASLIALPATWAARTRGIAAWDIGAAAFLLLCLSLFAGANPERMQRNATAQEEGEWTLFFLVVAGAVASFSAIIGEFSTMKGAPAGMHSEKVAMVAATLTLSWLLTHAVFALRYAHEYYTRTGGAPKPDGGLVFPSEDSPDYWDFLYFALVLGMTFQVSDVQITSRKLRRLATLHGLLGFLFNTVIVALTVNLASGLLS